VAVLIGTIEQRRLGPFSSARGIFRTDTLNEDSSHAMQSQAAEQVSAMIFGGTRLPPSDRREFPTLLFVGFPK
jgi:hypothetical protein